MEGDTRIPLNHPAEVQHVSEPWSRSKENGFVNTEAWEFQGRITNCWQCFSISEVDDCASGPGDIAVAVGTLQEHQ